MANLASMLRTANIFGQKPDQSTADAGGFNPLKRFMSGVSPEPKTPWQTMFQVPRFQQQPPQMQQPEEQDSMGGGDFLKQILEMSKPGPAMGAYQSALTQQPQQEDYRPSKWRTLAATIGGVGAGFSGADRGAAIAENISQGPYNRARQAWSDKIAGLGESAKVEADITGNQSKAYLDAMTRQQADRTFRHTLEKDAHTQGLEDDKFNLEVFKANAGDYQILETPNGPLLVDRKGINPSKQLNSVTLPMIKSILDERAQNTSDYNAETSRGQLGVALGGLQMRGREFQETQNQNQETNTRNWFNATQPDPSKENIAYSNSIREMYNDPSWRPYIEEVQRTNGQVEYRVKENVDLNNPLYKNFADALKSRTQQKSTQVPISPSVYFDPAKGYSGVGYTRK